MNGRLKIMYSRNGITKNIFVASNEEQARLFINEILDQGGDAVYC